LGGAAARGGRAGVGVPLRPGRAGPARERLPRPPAPPAQEAGTTCGTRACGQRDRDRMRPVALPTDLMTGTCFDCAAEPAYVMDPEHDRILAANDAGCALLGYTRDELLATPISCIHPSELPELA